MIDNCDVIDFSEQLWIRRLVDKSCTAYANVDFIQCLDDNRSFDINDDNRKTTTVDKDILPTVLFVFFSFLGFRILRKTIKAI